MSSVGVIRMQAVYIYQFQRYFQLSFAEVPAFQGINKVAVKKKKDTW